MSPDSYQRFTRADVTGDSAEEILVEIDRGRGVEIRSQDQRIIDRVLTTEHLTDLGAIAQKDSAKENLVLYTYPNATRGGTFTVMSVDRTEIGRWEVHPPPSRFDVGTWQGEPAVFYFQGAALVIRSSVGEVMARLQAPLAEKFSRIFVASGYGGRTIVLASGSGYTPYHMVCIYDADGSLAFQLIESEHAFRLEADESRPEFFVYARSDKWRFVEGLFQPPMIHPPQ